MLDLVVELLSGAPPSIESDMALKKACLCVTLLLSGSFLPYSVSLQLVYRCIQLCDLSLSTVLILKKSKKCLGRATR